MKRIMLICGIGLLAAWQVHAQQSAPVLEFAQQQPGKKDQPPDKGQPKVKEPKQPEPPPQRFDDFRDIFAPPSPDDTQISSGYNPQMMGDFFGLFARMNVRVCVTQTTVETLNPNFSSSPSSSTTTQTYTQNRAVLVPVASLGAFNVAENESPRPQDRVFMFYNYFSDLRGPNIGTNNTNISSSSQIVSQGPYGSITSTTTTVVPGVAQQQANLNREVFGFEKTFLGGQASFEVRLPLFQQLGSAPSNFGGYDVGDLTVVTKYAFILDRLTGNVLTGGLAVTLPTGPAISTVQGQFRTVYLQPWFGYIWNFQRFYVQGIHSVAMPTDAQAVALAFNSVGVNYWLYRGMPDQLLSFVVPTLEAHVTTPLNHRDLSSDPLVVPDVMIVTSGVHFGVGRSAVLTLGAAARVTGPTPFTVEGFAQFNWRF